MPDIFIEFIRSLRPFYRSFSCQMLDLTRHIDKVRKA